MNIKGKQPSWAIALFTSHRHTSNAALVAISHYFQLVIYFTLEQTIDWIYSPLAQVHWLRDHCSHFSCLQRQYRIIEEEHTGYSDTYSKGQKAKSKMRLRGTGYHRDGNYSEAGEAWQERLEQWTRQWRAAAHSMRDRDTMTCWIPDQLQIDVTLQGVHHSSSPLLAR